ncbi:MAG: ABC transporter permease [Actinobacteria bacterium]|nr:ABC transporter permease [Actinomycetota bacterium]
MRWRDAIGLAAKGLRRRPGRAVLTILAVALASALLTALLTIAGTAETRVLNELAKGGPLAGIKVAAASPDPGQVDQDDARPGPPKDLDQAALDRIRALADVREVVPIVATRMLVVAPGTEKDGRPRQPYTDDVVGVDITRASMLPVTLVAGQLPEPTSLVEVAVTEGYLQRVGVNKPDAATVLGTQLELASIQGLRVTDDHVVPRGQWAKVEIVGVVAQEAGAGQILAPVEQVNRSLAWTKAGVTDDSSIPVPTSTYSGLFVVAEGIDNVGKVRQEITAVGYATSAPENLLASVQRYLKVVEIVLTSIGAIALVVAALGISNAMLAAVRERTREIGVMKAIGGRDRDIRRIFLVEAGVLGFVGGVLGAITGWLIARAVGGVVNGYLNEQGLASIQLALPVPVLLVTVIGATVLALLAGTLPAMRAARLPARDAVGAV